MATLARKLLVQQPASVGSPCDTACNTVVRLCFSGTKGGRLGVVRKHARLGQCRCEIAAQSAGLSVEEAKSIAIEAEKEDEVPKPLVNIDQHTDPSSTIVELQFGDRLGALLDTMKSLRDLGLNVVKGEVETTGARGINRFFITTADTGEKVTDPELLESIRLVIIGNLLQYHPESSAQLALGTLKKVAQAPVVRRDIPTIIRISDDGERSQLYVETFDRAGLLVELVAVLKDLNISVEAADINTEGFVAKDYFYVKYHGDPLNKSMREVTHNALRYYLTRPDLDLGEDSY